jgi:DnaJ-class molecular chaperone
MTGFWGWSTIHVEVQAGDDDEPPRDDCSACDGVGVSIGSWPSGGRDCKHCGGTGYEPQVSGTGSEREGS